MLASACGREVLGSLGMDLGAATALFSALRCAFSIISSCFDLSFARIGTKSLGTGVLRVKFLENFMRSLSLIALSWVTR